MGYCVDEVFFKSGRVFKCVAEDIPPWVRAAVEVALLVLLLWSAPASNACIDGPMSRKF